LRAICRITGAEGEDAKGAADLGMAEGGGFGFAEGAEFAGAAFDGGAGDFVCERGGFGAGALGKREDMEIGEGEALDEGERGDVVVFSFAGEAGDDVGADGGVGETFVDEFDAACVVRGAIPAVHGGEHAVGRGLQGHVEVLGDAIGRGEEFDEVVGDVEGLDGADAETFDGGLIEDASEEVFEFDARGKVAAVGAEVDAAEDDFARWEKGGQRVGGDRRECLVYRGWVRRDRQECLSYRELPNFLDDRIGWEAAAFATDKWDDAVGTAGIAAVLDLERGASVVAFAAEDGGGEELGAVEDVADEDVVEMGRGIPARP